MDAFAALIADKKAKLSAKRKLQNAKGGGGGPKKRYRRRGEIVEEEEQERRREEERLEREAEAKAEAARAARQEKRKVREARERARKGLPPVSAAAADAAGSELKAEELPPVLEVKRRLRVLRRPITLFGENEMDRWRRLKAEEMTAHEREVGSMGAKDIFQEIIKNEVEEDLQNADLLDGMGEEMRREKMLKKQRRVAKYTQKRDRSSFKSDHAYVLHFLKRMLYEWEDDLERRDADEKRTATGKISSATQKQTRQFIKPFFKLLKKKTVSQDVFRHVLDIVSACDERKYKTANEAYMTLAIGNAAWPMGVTMVGIHERAGRSKIFSQNVAHVLNDETQRKYIQSIKRIMSFCKRKYPPVRADQMV